MTLHYQFQEGENLVVRGYAGNRERAEVVVNTGSRHDIGFQRKTQEAIEDLRRLRKYQRRRVVDEKHRTPHFHARCGGVEAVFDLTGKRIEGDLGRRATRLIEEWCGERRGELEAA